MSLKLPQIPPAGAPITTGQLHTILQDITNCIRVLETRFPAKPDRHFNFIRKTIQFLEVTTLDGDGCPDETDWREYDIPLFSDKDSDIDD